MATLGGLSYNEAMALAARGNGVTRSKWLLQGISRFYVKSKVDGKIVRYERGFGAVYELTEEDRAATDWQTL